MADDSEVLECGAACAEVQPHQFEPLARNFEHALTLSDSDEEEEDEEGNEERPALEPVGNDGNVDEWCTCGHCSVTETAASNFCCQAYANFRFHIGSGHTCITQTRGFDGNCLNEGVLEASIYEFVATNGPLGDEETHAETMRYIAYRRLIRWTIGILGRGNRRPLPACCVTAIRNAFPGDYHYRGFQYSIY